MAAQKILTVIGTGILVKENDIDTDRILPARYLKEVTFDNMGKYVFFDERHNGDGTLKGHTFDNPRYAGASILFVQKNFGCGSSREHAPQGLMRYGIKAIVGESFADIFSGNCTKIGVPAVTASQSDIAGLMGIVESRPTTAFKIDLMDKMLIYSDKSVPIDMPEPRRKALTEGLWDSTSLLLANSDKTRGLAMHLPYVRGFGS